MVRNILSIYRLLFRGEKHSVHRLLCDVLSCLEVRSWVQRCSGESTLSDPWTTLRAKSHSALENRVVLWENVWRDFRPAQATTRKRCGRPKLTSAHDNNLLKRMAVQHQRKWSSQLSADFEATQERLYHPEQCSVDTLRRVCIAADYARSPCWPKNTEELPFADALSQRPCRRHAGMACSFSRCKSIKNSSKELKSRASKICPLSWGRLSMWRGVRSREIMWGISLKVLRGMWTAFEGLKEVPWNTEMLLFLCGPLTGSFKSQILSQRGWLPALSSHVTMEDGR